MGTPVTLDTQSPLLTGLGAAGQYAQTAFADNQATQQLALARLKQQQENQYQMGELGVDQGKLSNDTRMVDPQIGELQSRAAQQQATAGYYGKEANRIQQLLPGDVRQQGAQTNLTTQEAASYKSDALYKSLLAHDVPAMDAAQIAAHYAGANYQNAEASIGVPARAAAEYASAADARARAPLYTAQADWYERNVNNNGDPGGSYTGKSGTPNADLAIAYINRNPELSAIYQHALANGKDYGGVMQDKGFAQLLNQNPTWSTAMALALGTPAARRDSLSFSEQTNNQGRAIGSLVSDFMNASAGQGQPTIQNQIAKIDPTLVPILTAGLKSPLIGGDPSKLYAAIQTAVSGTPQELQRMGYQSPQQALQAMGFHSPQQAWAAQLFLQKILTQAGGQ